MGDLNKTLLVKLLCMLISHLVYKIYREILEISFPGQIKCKRRGSSEENLKSTVSYRGKRRRPLNNSPCKLPCAH